MSSYCIQQPQFQLWCCNILVGGRGQSLLHLDTKKQVSQTISACSFYLRNINQISRFLPRPTKEHVVNAIITSRLDYCNALLYGTSAINIARLQRIQNTAASMKRGRASALRRSTVRHTSQRHSALLNRAAEEEARSPYLLPGIAAPFALLPPALM
ncbi:hypothetical protein NP493_721g01022 [Ridgeia piscesae]|uniref:Uncharacterized protein n=1 Tax=Ridgeia piscesae TaxID=27915 RepID=A0AAD9KPX9_RIDPI|nr:hypothetical protein NP493_721g01022 [Ridgeia piscesae]